MNAVAARIAERRVVAILRCADPVAVGTAVIEGGVDVVEVPLNVPGALDAISSLSAMPGALVGAGTVMSAADARAALDAGARFLLSPVLRPEVVEAAHAAGAAAVPGAFTPTEVDACTRAGADLVKLFPADRLTPADLRTLLAALPDARLLPSGGISAANAAAWLAAGAVAVGVGGALTREPERAPELLAALAG
ncbi:MAG: bifunctional 4-hydroxy-2-oxoglutarate aldolase/2-dehydro-3-deoxy-phosphogluconate aldolase [Actinobacteria bacterium]|nr:bifunctional 4-hydroxy-2-oxoglutarate aldolase/2-dehydro-3-deoxy-phosphogluconate aldolase [Actinomycetota bacterium]